MAGFDRQHLALREPARAPRFRRAVAPVRNRARGRGDRRAAAALARRTSSQIGDVRQMAWLHLKLLAARAAFVEVIDVADRERKKLDEQERALPRPARGQRHGRGAAPQPRAAARSHQVAPRRARRCRAAHSNSWTRSSAGCASRYRWCASRRCSPPTRTASRSRSTRCRASLNEANRWLKDQRELFAGLDNFTDEPPPADLLASKRAHASAPRRFRSERQSGRSTHGLHVSSCTRLGRRQHHHPAAVGGHRRPGRLAVARQERRREPRRRARRPPSTSAPAKADGGVAAPEGDAPDAHRARHRHADARSRQHLRAEGQRAAHRHQRIRGLRRPHRRQRRPRAECRIPSSPRNTASRSRSR